MAVNVKMGVDLGSFKSGITEAKNEVKTLDANMKLIDATFKATGNAEQALAQKMQTLNSKFTAQQNLAKQYEQALRQMTAAGVDPASAAYQKMARDLLNAQAGMMETQAALNGLDGSQQNAAKSADQLSASVNNIGKKLSLDQVISGIDKITSGLANAAKKAVQLGEELWNSIMDSAAYADDISTMATMMGLTDEEAQKMVYVAGRFEAPAEQMAKTWKKVKMNLTSDSEDVAAAFHQLGIRTKEWGEAGQSGPALIARNYKDVFWEVGEALMHVSDASKQERLAQTLLGRSWDEMIPLFKAGRKAYEEALENAPAATEEAVEAAASLNDRVKELEKSWDTLKLEVVGAIAPALEKGADAIGKVLDSLTEYLQSEKGQELLESLGTAVSDMLKGLSEISAEDIVSNFSSLLSSLTAGLDWINQNGATVTGIIEGLGIAFATLTVSSSVLEFVKIIQGLRGLGGGAAAGAAAANGGNVAAGATAAAAGVGAAETLLDTKLSQAGATFNVLDTTWKLIENANTDGSLSRADQVRQWVNRQVEDGFIPEAEAEEYFKKNLAIFEELGEDVTVPIGVKPEDGAAEKLAGDIGVVDVPVKFVPVGEPIAGPAYLPRNVGQPWRNNANGVWSVPYDGYLARLHKNERVVPAREIASRSFSSNLYVENMNMGGGMSADALAATIAARNRRMMAGYGS